MKNIFIIIAILILIFSQTLFAQGWQWIDTGYPFHIFDLSFPPGQSDIGFAVGSNLPSGGDGIILKTSNAGVTWSQIPTGPIPGLKSVCFTSTDVGYVVGYQNLLMKTTDGGSIWIPQAIDSKSSYYNNIEFWDANNGIIVSYPSAVYITNDAGTTWTLATGIKQSVEDICYADANTAYLVGDDEKISKSTDGGSTWIDIYTGVPQFTFLGVEFFNPSYGIVTGEDGKVLVTVDGGNNWTTSNVSGSWLINGAHIVSEQNAYVVGTPEKVFKTTDGGITWVSDFNGANAVALYKIKFTENNAGIICGSQGKFLINTDYVPVELKGFTASVDGNDVFFNWITETELNNYGFEIHRSTMGSDWENIAFIPGFGTTSEPKSYSFNDKQLKNGTYSYRLKQIDLNGNSEFSDIVNVFVSIPGFYNLEQNYPNPFNPSTIIEFSLPENVSNVKLSIYNAIGEMEVELVNSELHAGKYSYQWDAKNFTTGMYIYVLRTDKFVSVKKMILIK